MATPEFTSASQSVVTQAQFAALQSSPQTNGGIAPSLANAQSPHSESSPPASFKPRQLKISYLPQPHESVPFLRMSGKWLAEAGFHIGGDVRVTVAEHRLIVETKSPESKSRSQIRKERRAALKNMTGRNAATTAVAYPSLGSVEMAHAAVCDPCLPARSCQDSAAIISRPTHNRQSSCSIKEVRQATQARGTWPERIGATLQPALGDILSEERSRLDLHPATIATQAQVNESVYRAIDRGDRQPNLSTFIAIAWTLDQDPRELFDKLLLQMGFPPGTRPVLLPQRN